MNKFFTFLSFMSFSALFSQITITSNIPSNISANAIFDAEIKISKGSISNFAKYQMEVPVGFVVSSVDVKGGNFTFDNQRAKIVWVSVPGESEFAVKFKIQAGSGVISPCIFTQKFYYLENGEKKEVEGTTATVTIGNGASSSAIASNNNETKPNETMQPVKETPAEVVKTELVKTVVVETVKETPAEVVKTEPVKTVAVETIKETTNTTSSSTTRTNNLNSSTSTTELTYKIQLGAFVNEPTKGRFKGINNVSIDYVNGMYKVTTGSFNTKEEALKYRDEIAAKGYDGLFLAKFQNGKRIN